MNTRLATLALLLIGGSADAQTCMDPEKVLPGTFSFNPRFGETLALEGPLLVVGAWRSLNGGSVYVFDETPTGWVEVQELAEFTDEQLGASVDLDAGSIVAGAPVAFDGMFVSGRAYVYTFEQGSWQVQGTLSSGAAQHDGRFGGAVAIDGNTVAVGAPHEDPLGSKSGAAYVFVRAGTEWAQQAKLVPAGGEASDRFGFSIDVQDDVLVVGAPQLAGEGAVYVFERTGTQWAQTAKVGGTPAEAGGRFGAAVALDLPRVLVGAPRTDVADADSGAAFVFAHSGSDWQLEQRLEGSGGKALDLFGSDVALEGDIAVVGGPGVDELGQEAGAGYVFDRASGPTWIERTPLFDPQADDGDALGRGAAIDGDRIALGAPGVKVNNMDFGAALVFDQPVADPEGYCTAKTNSLGCVPLFTFLGCPIAGATSGFELRVVSTRNQSAGILGYGLDGPAGFPFQGGFLCIQPPVYRTPAQGSGGSPKPNQDCTGILTIDMNRFAAGAGGGNPRPELSLPGTDVWCQWFSRDQGDAFKSGLSDALHYVVSGG